MRPSDGIRMMYYNYGTSHLDSFERSSKCWPTEPELLTRAGPSALWERLGSSVLGSVPFVYGHHRPRIQVRSNVCHIITRSALSYMYRLHCDVCGCSGHPARLSCHAAGASAMRAGGYQRPPAAREVFLATEQVPYLTLMRAFLTSLCCCQLECHPARKHSQPMDLMDPMEPKIRVLITTACSNLCFMHTSSFSASECCPN